MDDVIYSTDSEEHKLNTGELTHPSSMLDDIDWDGGLLQASFGLYDDDGTEDLYGEESWS
ncbi:MAG: hypothetical protein HRT61_23070 [Ekhidna sp.]|nr:hypothetical protein [Ekhidna sp.]